RTLGLLPGVPALPTRRSADLAKHPRTASPFSNTTPRVEARLRTARSRRSCLNDEPTTTARPRPRTRRPDPDVQLRRGPGAADDRRRPDPAFAATGAISIRG